MSEKRVGILGGTFDPVHNGHLAIAEGVCRTLGLAEVLLVPAPRPWMKAGLVCSGAEDRLTMIELAVAGQPGLSVSRVDIDRPGPTYSIDTIRDLRRQLGPGVDLYFIVGADTLAEMAGWREPERIFGEARVVAVARRGHLCPARLPGGHPGREALFVDATLVDVSATDIRHRVGRGQAIDGLVSPDVERFIRDHGLYRGLEADGLAQYPRRDTQ